MSKNHNFNLDKLGDSKHAHGTKALEMIMRDVIDGMEDIANMAGYSPQPGSCFEILEILPEEPVSPPPPEQKPTAEVISISSKPPRKTA